MTELTINQALQQGVEAHKAGQVQDADRLYTAILKAQPKHPDANHNMGVLAVGVDKVQEALPFFKTALEANPATAQFWLSYIDALIKLDKLADAKAMLDQARSKGAKGDGFDKLEKRLNEDSQESLKASKLATEAPHPQPNTLDSLKLDQAIKLAKKKAKEGDPEKAKRIYQDILAKFPKNKRAIDGLKRLASHSFGKVSKDQNPPQDQLQSLINLYSQGASKQALEQTETLVQKFPMSAVLFNIQGAILASLGELDRSIEVYKKAIALKPDFGEAYNNIGNALKEQGKLNEAIEAYNKALTIKPDNAEANNNRGVALQEQGKPEEAIEAYIKAIAIKPDYADAHHNMGVTLKGQGKLDGAIEACLKAIAIRPNYAAAYYNMGITLHEQGKLKEAIEAYNKALAIKPDYAEGYYNMGNALRAQSKLEEAIEAFNKALAIKPDYTAAYTNMGVTLQEQGKLEEAIEAYYKTLTIKSDYVEAYNNIGNARQEQGKLKEAIEAYSKALAIKPDYIEVHKNMGFILQEQGKLEEAIEAYNKALVIKPDYAEAWSDGAAALEKWNKLARLELWLEKAFQAFTIAPPDIRLMKSKLLWRNKNKKEASKIISNINFENVTQARQQDYLQLKAKCFDSSNDFDKAYACFFESNLLVKQSNLFGKCNPEIFFQGLRHQLTTLKARSLQAPIIHPIAEPGFTPVFLVGFPRSGTTLLDTILRSHSKIDVVEERTMVSSAKAFIKKNGYSEIDEALPQALISGAKKAYITELDKHRQLEDNKPILIDKLPLNLLQIPLIQQLYPQAKFILVLRHPLDTTLSCWMQNFKLNPAMANMVDLDRIVEFYCVAMETFKICRVRYNLNVHQIKYEDLLEDLSGETSALLKFLDLDWEAQMENYQETALKRGRINTPSYSQVVQPIYKDSKYRWLHYEKHLRQYVAEVEPWIDEYGYSKQ